MQHKPLDGIRILELGGYISAPYASSLLCALGAEVVKVEKPGTGEDFRRLKNDRSPYFVQYNAGKRSLAVDLKNPEGIALVKSLVPRFDVVLENLRAGKLAALGLGPEECTALRPDLVYASVTGFGNGGPLAQRPAYDTIGQASAGLYSLLSDAGQSQLSGTILADLITGVSTAAGVLAALVGRAATGAGQHVETSVMEAVTTLTADAVSQYFDDGHRNPSRQSRHPQAQNFCLKTATGEDIAIHLSSSQKFWHCLLTAMDRHDLGEDPRFATYPERERNYFELVEIVQAEFLTRPSAEWEKRLGDADVPFTPVLTVSGVMNHPQTEWLQLFEPEDNGVSLLRPPWRFGGTRPDRGGVAPRVGQHTREIAGEVYDASRIEELLASGVLFADA
ncbi:MULTISPECIES: CaiB/BaiF CoA transferase family protein [Streptomyces]|uniref:CoA transferase n=1 Tax=Streptomyces cinereoruber TaxID=67260 RepID=A0ABX6BMA1_9ACTN|nr:MULTISPECIES: CaiB/BaiF CoA-transferase family protein [Streptomyces]AVH94199.1 CoA transferase [Streptomyces sp. WAC00288]KYG51378.1 CoA-transferase [Streptomyces sp. WAC04657]MBB4162297.1 crotonobetainyl-CoA:carnitine CoA-transferase CaiB-like acyl-CoA transferase [Streptomyces cinereoruber]NIH63400.1 crotonobetainyl-CoA:carnitine CoA-transferase CaiB-like acyl-CoA transferase [Streptomyces cinereoruber]QEV36055.1 CoA transferase [Streptomyces cinereoruber]